MNKSIADKQKKVRESKERKWERKIAPKAKKTRRKEELRKGNEEEA